MKKNYRYYVQRYTYTRTKKLGWCIYCKYKRTALASQNSQMLKLLKQGKLKKV